MVDWEISHDDGDGHQTLESLRNRSMLIVRHAENIIQHAENFLMEEQLEIQLANGSIKMPWLIMAGLSSIFKDYLSYIEKATLMEPLVIIPDLNVEDFQVFKKHLFYSGDVAQLSNATFIIQRVYEHLGCDILKKEPVVQQEINVEIYTNDNQEDDIQDDRHMEESRQKKVPSIISNSSYGRPRRLPKRLSSIEYTDEENDVVNDTETSSLSCPYCSKTYAQIKARNRHMLSDHTESCKRDDAYYPCDTCSAIFVSILGREKHVKRMHPVRSNNQINSFSCPFSCRDPPRFFEKLKDFHAHIKESHPNRDKSCFGCGAYFSSMKDLEEHIQSHRLGQPESKPFFFCEHCGQVLLREYSLVMHKRNKHPTIKGKLECRYCKKDFKNAKFLKNHEEKHRLGPIEEGSHFCELCGKGFPTLLSLNRHIKGTHNKVKDHQCPECGKKFVDSTRLKEHRWIHTDHKPHQCKLCDQSFRHKNHLKHHEAKVHGKRKEFECDICHKTFCYNYELRNHTKTSHENSKKLRESSNAHHGIDLALDNELTKYEFECQLCQQRFPSIPALRDHCTQHSQEELARDTTALRRDENTLPIGGADDIKPQNVGTEHILLEVEAMDDIDGVHEESSYVIEYITD